MKKILKFVASNFFWLIIVVAIVIGISYRGFEWKDSNDGLINDCEWALDSIAAHIFDVGEYQGIEYDDEGRGVDMYIFENSDLDFNVLNPHFDKIKEVYKEFNEKLENKGDDFDKETNDDLDRIFSCYKTGMFFIYPEKIERAWYEDDYKSFRNLYEKIKYFKKDKLFISWLKDNVDSEDTSDYDKYLKVLEVMEEFVSFIDLSENIDRLSEEVDAYDEDLEYYDAIGDIDNYNYLVPIYNDFLIEGQELLDGYNIFFEGWEDWYMEWYYSFVGVADLYLLFPEQDKFEIVNDEAEQEST